MTPQEALQFYQALGPVGQLLFNAWLIYRRVLVLGRELANEQAERQADSIRHAKELAEAEARTQAQRHETEYWRQIALSELGRNEQEILPLKQQLARLIPQSDSRGPA